MADVTERDLFPPGEFIKDELEARGWTQESLAHILDRPLNTVNQIISGKKAITPQTAQELAAAFGTSAELWMNLESAYRLSLQPKGQNEVAHRARLYEIAPVREMIRRRWIQEATSPFELETAINAFFDIPPLKVAARQSSPYENATPPQRAWLCRVFRLASTVDASQFVRQKAVEAIPALQALTASEQEARKVPAALAAMGIRFLVVEHLSQTKIDGAAFWLNPKSPVIVVSLRYDRIDAFWHTLAHELSHILRGDVVGIDDDLIGVGHIGYENRSEIETRADDDASQFLISRPVLDSFISRHRPRFSKVNIIRFANLHRIHPGIVVGQLQHRGAIKYSHSREMLVPVRTILSETAMTDGWGHFLAI
jgi:HTH-type transcriptional regulator/antitoxin HigA